jgi:hypothetical protein
LRSSSRSDADRAASDLEVTLVHLLDVVIRLQAVIEEQGHLLDRVAEEVMPLRRSSGTASGGRFDRQR